MRPISSLDNNFRQKWIFYCASNSFFLEWSEVMSHQNTCPAWLCVTFLLELISEPQSCVSLWHSVPSGSGGWSWNKRTHSQRAGGLLHSGILPISCHPSAHAVFICSRVQLLLSLSHDHLSVYSRGQAEALLRRLLPTAPVHPRSVHQPLPGPLHHYHYMHQRLHHEHRALQSATGNPNSATWTFSCSSYTCPWFPCLRVL